MRAMAHKGVSHRGDNWLHQGHPSSCGFSPLSLPLKEEMGWMGRGVAHGVSDGGCVDTKAGCKESPDEQSCPCGQKDAACHWHIGQEKMPLAMLRDAE